MQIAEPRKKGFPWLRELAGNHATSVLTLNQSRKYQTKTPISHHQQQFEVCEPSHRDYIGVESEPYECGTRTSANKPPCPAWSLGDARCFMCDQKCEEMHDVRNPRSSALLAKLGCTASCVKLKIY